MVHDHFLHILKYLRFADNENLPDKNSPNYYRFWKLINVFYILKLRFSKVYQPIEHLSVDEIKNLPPLMSFLPMAQCCSFSEK
jgi:hypothetical protein